MFQQRYVSTWQSKSPKKKIVFKCTYFVIIFHTECGDNINYMQLKTQHIEFTHTNKTTENEAKNHYIRQSKVSGDCQKNIVIFFSRNKPFFRVFVCCQRQRLIKFGFNFQYMFWIFIMCAARAPYSRHQCNRTIGCRWWRKATAHRNIPK